MEVQSNENAALLKLLKTKSRTKTELLKVSSARRRARQAALDALLAEGKVIRIDKEYFANDPSGSVEELIHAEAVRLDALPAFRARASFPFGQETQTGHER